MLWSAGCSGLIDVGLSVGGLVLVLHGQPSDGHAVRDWAPTVRGVGRRVILVMIMLGPRLGFPVSGVPGIRLTGSYLAFGVL